MTIKELIPKLIEHYEKCINEMPEEGWRSYINKNHIGSGICNCSQMLFDEAIYFSDFVKRFTRDRVLLCPSPYSANSQSEAKELLQIRLNRLRDFI